MNDLHQNSHKLILLHFKFEIFKVREEREREKERTKKKRRAFERIYINLFAYYLFFSF